MLRTREPWGGRAACAALAVCAVLFSPLLAGALRLAYGGQAGSVYVKKRQFERRGRPTTEMDSADSILWLDSQTDMPVYYLLKQSPPSDGSEGYPLRVSEADARSAALRFLGRIGLRLDGLWSLCSAELIDHGVGKTYHFRWEKRLGEVELPASCTLAVDATTGSVELFAIYDDAVTVPLAWRIPAAQAVAAVATTRGWAAWDLESVDLHVWYASEVWDEKNQISRPVGQGVFWRVKVWYPGGRTREDDRRSFADMEVNAVTGEIAREYVYAGQPRRPDRKVFERAKKLLAAMPKPNPTRKLVAPPTIFQTAVLKKAHK